MAFDQNIGAWFMGNVTLMSGMLKHCTTFNQNISNWNTSKVTDMSGIFRGCSAFNQDLSSWDVSQVTTMNHMFYGAASFKQDLSAWTPINVTSFTQFLYNVDINDPNSSSNTHNLDALYNSWALQAVQTGLGFHIGTATNGSSSSANLSTLTTAKNWTIYSN